VQRILLKDLLKEAKSITLKGIATGSDLARFLGVTRQQVSIWISSQEYKPNGQAALDIYQWVKHNKNKKPKKK
jgi:hypothetical protein